MTLSDSSTNLGLESETVEFKKSTAELKEAFISIASILNKHGKGRLFFGVRNDGDVIGQAIGENTLRTVSQAIHSHITPTIYPEIEKRTLNGFDVIEVDFEGTERPYLAYNIPRIRVSDEDLLMDQVQYERLLQNKKNVDRSWKDRFPSTRCSISILGRSIPIWEGLGTAGGSLLRRRTLKPSLQSWGW